MAQPYADLPEKELEKRTLTDLYNDQPSWIRIAHLKRRGILC